MIRLFEGDSLDVLRATPDGTYTYVISDPPYGLSTPPDPLEVMRQWLADGDFHRKVKGSKGKAGGFMGAEWDHFVPGPVLWREVFRTCKPGAIVLCFAATRTMDWMSLSLRCAGFEILDVIAWMQAQGMAKAGTIDKKIDARNNNERPVVGTRKQRASTAEHSTNNAASDVEHLTIPASAESAAWAGWSTQLAPGYEPIIVARRPCEGTATANVLQHGCGAMNIDACRIGIDPAEREVIDNRSGRPSGTQQCGFAQPMEGAPPLWKSAPGGRWPKNVLLSADAAAVLDEQVGERKSGSRKAGTFESGLGYGGTETPGERREFVGSTGGASRFFWVGPLATEDDCALPGRYVPKVRTAERHAGLPEGVKSTHPTVKPQALMEWLCRLVGHPQGRGLDPFAGSGSTLRAARALGLAFDGIERDPTFAEIARHRAGIHGEAPASPTPPCETPPDCPEEWDSALERETA